MKRRSFLVGGGVMTVSGLMTGCGDRQGKVLKVRFLKDSIPAQLLGEFRQKFKRSPQLDFTPETQIDRLFDRLQNWQKKPPEGNWWTKIPLPFGEPREVPPADLVTLGDYWLNKAIEQKLIQPLDPKQLSRWKELPQQWQNLVTRNGKVWGAPYRWGSTVIAYRRDKFESNRWKLPADWSDLWREELRDRISLLDRPREAIGLTLKKLGYSYNTAQLDKIPNLKREMLSLHRQVKFYSSDTYLEPLILGDTYLAVGWSGDILPLMQNYRNIAAVVPQSGTALWTDLWVHPVGANSDFNLAQQWIDFCWQPEIARVLSRFTQAASPILADSNAVGSIEDSKERVLFPTADILKKSEFLLPLPQKSLLEYRSLWREIRSN